MCHVYGMLKDTDARVRNEAASAIARLYLLQIERVACVKNHNTEHLLIAELVAELLTTEVSLALDKSAGSLIEFYPGFSHQNVSERHVKTVLGKLLFDITNKLFETKSTEHSVRQIEKPTIQNRGEIRNELDELINEN